MPGGFGAGAARSHPSLDLRRVIQSAGRLQSGAHHRLQARDDEPSLRTSAVDQLLGREAGPCPQVGEVAFGGARADADARHVVGNRSAGHDEGGEHVQLAPGLPIAAARRAGTRLSREVPGRGEPLIATLDGHVVGCYRVSDTCRARHSAPQEGPSSTSRMGTFRYVGARPAPRPKPTQWRRVAARGLGRARNAAVGRAC